MITNLKWATSQLLNLAPLFFLGIILTWTAIPRGLPLNYFLSVQSMLNPICTQPSAVRESQGAFSPSQLLPSSGLSQEHGLAPCFIITNGGALVQEQRRNLKSGVTDDKC